MSNIVQQFFSSPFKLPPVLEKHTSVLLHFFGKENLIESVVYSIKSLGLSCELCSLKITGRGWLLSRPGAGWVRSTTSLVWLWQQGILIKFTKCLAAEPRYFVSLHWLSTVLYWWWTFFILMFNNSTAASDWSIYGNEPWWSLFGHGP